MCLCYRCTEAFKAEEVAKVRAGERSWCRRCSIELEGGFDWGRGWVRPGPGICQSCFVGAVNTVTEIIKAGRPLDQLLALATGGTKEERALDFARGERVTDEEQARTWEVVGAPQVVTAGEEEPGVTWEELLEKLQRGLEE